VEKIITHLVRWFLLLPGFLLATQALGAEPLKEKYQWNSPQDAKIYKDALWEPIRTPRLSSFPEPFTEKWLNCMQFDNDSPPEGLRREGGLCGTYVWLERWTKGALEKIDTPEKLRQALAPIDSEAKAVDIITLLRSGFAENPGGIPEGHILKTDQGYLVQLKDSNKFSCSDHVPFWVIFSVDREGNHKVAAFQKRKEKRSQVMCVD